MLERISLQGKACVNSEGNCVYRAVVTQPDGTQKRLGCAVGILLDDKLAEEFDASELPLEVIIEKLSVPSWMRDNVKLLRDLQRAHDISGDENWLSFWKQSMMIIAERYSLNYV